MSEETNETNETPSPEDPSAAPPPDPSAPSLFRNYISLAGAAIAVACMTSIILLILVEFTSGTNNPYLGIFTYVLLPSVLAFGLLIIFAGMYLERRRRRRLAPNEVPTYPSLDLNDPRRRRALFLFLGLAFFFICMSAFGSYQAYEFSESVAFCGTTCHTVMKPEFEAFKASPHARIRCVDCHVGPGAGGYASAKLNGMHQLYSVAFNKFSRPIATPVHNMPSAEFTCTKCHWPERFYGDQLKVIDHFAYDEQNTRNQTRMLIHVGGGSPETGPVSGIHWHMNLANEITFITSDEHRQTIPWVRMKDQQGNVTDFVAAGASFTPAQIESTPKRRMDCMDCHSRPAHIYLSPAEAVDSSLAAGKLAPTLPYLKREAVAILSKPYSTNDEAVATIGRELEDFYRTNYADIYSNRGGDVKGAVTELRRIYQTYFFPEMKTDWRAHANNIGHYYAQGCFRCHDGQHFSSAGKVIRNECNTCHTTLDQSVGGAAPVAAVNGTFQHPIALGDLAGKNCTVCHSADRAFQHPTALGDLSSFKCIDCHAGKVWSGGQ
jgi:hypothetical protein